MGGWTTSTSPLLIKVLQVEDQKVPPRSWYRVRLDTPSSKWDTATTVMEQQLDTVVVVEQVDQKSADTDVVETRTPGVRGGGGGDGLREEEGFRRGSSGGVQRCPSGQPSGTGPGSGSESSWDLGFLSERTGPVLFLPFWRLQVLTPASQNRSARVPLGRGVKPPARLCLC